MVIDVAYVPTFRDFLALNRWIARRRWRAARNLAVVAIALFLAGPLLFRDPDPGGYLAAYPASLAAAVLAAAAMAVFPAILFFSARKRWHTAPEIREPRRFVFSEDGITVTGGTFSGRVAWSHITRADSHRGLFFLKTNQNLYYVVPEKGLADDAERRTFLSLVRRKVSPTFGRKSALGRVKFLEPARTLDRG